MALGKWMQHGILLDEDAQPEQKAKMGFEGYTKGRQWKMMI